MPWVGPTRIMMVAVQDSTRAVGVQAVTASSAEKCWQACPVVRGLLIGFGLERPDVCTLQVEKEDAGRPIPVAVMKGAPEVIRQHLKHVGGTLLSHCKFKAAGSPVFELQGSAALTMRALVAALSSCQQPCPVSWLLAAYACNRQTGNTRKHTHRLTILARGPLLGCCVLSHRSLRAMMPPTSTLQRRVPA